MKIKSTFGTWIFSQDILYLTNCAYLSTFQSDRTFQDEGIMELLPIYSQQTPCFPPGSLMGTE